MPLNVGFEPGSGLALMIAGRRLETVASLFDRITPKDA